MEKTHMLIVGLLIVAILFSVASIAISVSMSSGYAVNVPQNVNSGGSGNIHLVIEKPSNVAGGNSS